MKSYNFNLTDYHDINEAKIKLNGITVIAGINGSGKSTISRWLYGYVKFANEFESIIDNKVIDKLLNSNNLLWSIQRRLALWIKDYTRPIFPLHLTNPTLEEIAETIFNRIKNISKILKTLEKKDQLAYSDWLKNALPLSNNNIEDFDQLVQDFETTSEKEVLNSIREAEKTKENHFWNDLLDIIENFLNLSHESPDKFSFFENGASLIQDERFFAPIGLKKAIYIDSPMAVTNRIDYGKNIWNNLKTLLYTPSKEIPEEAKEIILKIKMIIGGNLKLEKHELQRKPDLRFIRKYDGLDISIDDVATGMKSFAYILQLLENGYIDGNTLLIIDEPEAHLHPQWVVKFAQILVLLHKKLGTQILLASHDPDMIAALKAISGAEGISENINFYQAEKDVRSHKFNYKFLGNDISQIFECFNIAIDDIEKFENRILKENSEK